ncbi:SMP-30/gluconolactonase/LRE family protein [Brevibacterium daeguense]|uniref:SMP-30/gluconolactonase/LRE family protein n=1 Tax=Brevibacterium daeguense TaxID=909936 RepID=A0ABP8EIL0_9MICO|nr:SMP-30/gluconolactonase/LRE family protein [Brevibacterium daeguense]
MSTEPTTAEPTIVLDQLSFLEGPRWHDGRVWVSDFYTHQVLSAREDGSDRRVEAEVPQQPSGLGWLPDGRLLIVSMRDQKILRREEDGSLVTHADLQGKLNDKLNDMVVDREGRAYVGAFGFDLMGGASLTSSSIVRVDPDGTVEVAAEDLWFPNGMVLTDDNVLLVAETFGNRISAFDVAADGSLGARRDWASFGPAPSSANVKEALQALTVAPDGCSGAADGTLWIADADSARAIRVREGGEIVEEISVSPGVYACALGGEDGKTLFLCTAPDFAEGRRKNAREAQLQSVRVSVEHGGLP